MFESLFNKDNLKKTATQVFFLKYCEIFYNTLFTEHLRWLLLPLATIIPIMQVPAI